MHKIEEFYLNFICLGPGGVMFACMNNPNRLLYATGFYIWISPSLKKNVQKVEIIKYVQCFQLGVNGYSFAVNNNGYILYHPDLRPMVNQTACLGLDSTHVSSIRWFHSLDLASIKIF